MYLKYLESKKSIYKHILKLLYKETESFISNGICKSLKILPLTSKSNYCFKFTLLINGSPVDLNSLCC